MKPFNFMEEAFIEAKKSESDIPVGCIIELNGEIIARAHNEKELNNDPTAHAEILAIKMASNKLNSWRLLGCNLYVTLEPCPMCAWAILNSRINAVYFSSYDIKYGAMGSKINLSDISNHKIKVYGGIMEDFGDKLLDDYFKNLRK